MNEGISYQPVRIAIIGAGNVGATFAYTLLLSGLATEIVIVDIDKARAEGEVMDLNHAAPFTNATRIWAGDYSDCAGAVITVIAAGSMQKPGEERLALLKKNAAVFHQIVPQIVHHNPDGIILVATNPVDLLTHITNKLSGLPANRVIGSGTILDTARFRVLLSQYFGVDPHSIHAYIIGEHGDSEVPVWSLATVAGMNLHDFSIAIGKEYNQAAMDNIFRLTRDAAYSIIASKGATYYAIAAGLTRIVEAILRDQSTVLSVSSLIEDFYGISNVCLSLPTIINRNGIKKVLYLTLSDEEIMQLRHSAEVLQNAAIQMNEDIELLVK